MNYYERIQKAIEYIENNLENHIDIGSVASEAYMSLSSFYRMFFALTGHAAKEYIRKRRMKLAIEDILVEKDTIMSIAIKYGFESSDTFSRTFKQIVGCSPSRLKEENIKYNFERMDVLDKYLDVQDKELLERYPDVKVLKKIEPMTVAYYRYYGKDPECNAFKVLLQWGERNNLTCDNKKYRLFGYDTPDCEPGSEEYGYEACITIDDDFDVEDDIVKVKRFEGGAYAVTTVKVKDIPKAWQRFKTWVKISKYDFGSHQWFEEHLDGINEKFDYDVDLYMPICEKSKFSIEALNDTDVVMCKVMGEEETAPFEAWSTLLNWAKANGILNTSEKHRFFAYHNYNMQRKGIIRWYIAMVTVDGEVNINDIRLKREVFGGGSFVTCSTDFSKLPQAWNEAANWTGLNGHRINPKVKWREEWNVQEGKLYPADYPKIKIYMPIK